MNRHFIVSIILLFCSNIYAWLPISEKSSIGKKYTINNRHYELEVKDFDGSKFHIKIKKIDFNGNQIILVDDGFGCNTRKEPFDARLFVTKDNLYLNYGDEFSSPNLIKISEKGEQFWLVFPVRPLEDNIFNYEFIDDKIYAIIKQDSVFLFQYPNFAYTGQKKYFLDEKNLFWVAVDNENKIIENREQSAISGWLYDGILKRWYPRSGSGDMDIDVWLSGTPSKRIIAETESLRNEKFRWIVETVPEFKEKISEEKKYLKLEEEKRIAEEKQKRQQKIFIILGILFLITFSVFLIKKRKKKKIINDKNIELNH